jgi:hypothetical protein
MADTADLVDRLSFLGGNEEARADVPDATSAVPDGDEEAQTLADLQAELAGQDPPQGDPADAEPDDALAAALTPEQVAAILAENEAFKAAQAQADAEQVDPVMGQQQWERETAANEADEVAAYYRGKSAPSAIDTLTQRYALDETDRNALAKFINYPPEHLEAIAQTLGAKNQRQTLTHQQITTQAAANQKARLSRLPAPGTPGAARPKAPYKWGTNRQAETELVAEHFLGIRR